VHLRDMLDDVQKGAEIVIERYRKPAVVMMSYSQWQALKKLQEAALLAEAKRNLARAEAEPHTVVSQAELKRRLKAKAAGNVDH
jgi:PHD/YefM family antitoxin component YafN of YafNO toxin-antitoxin module